MEGETMATKSDSDLKQVSGGASDVSPGDRGFIGRSPDPAHKADLGTADLSRVSGGASDVSPGDRGFIGRSPDADAASSEVVNEKGDRGLIGRSK